MQRREFITLISCAAASPLAARAQQTQKKRVVGVLQDLAEDEPIAQSEVAAFRD